MTTADPEQQSPQEKRRVRRAYLEERLRFIRHNLANLERDKRRIPWLLLLGFIAIPVGIYKGLLMAFLVVVGTVFTVSSGFYLVWGHRSEYIQKIQELEAELKRL